MRYFVGVFLFLGSMAFSYSNQVIVTTSGSINPDEVFSELNISKWRQIGENQYRLTVEGNQTEAQLLEILQSHLEVGAAENEQASSLTTLEGATSLDSRIIFIIDSVTEEATYHVSEAELDSRIIFIIDGSGATFPELYRQYHVTDVNAHLAWEHSNGQDRVVAVIDTGVDVNHPFLSGNIVPGYDFVDGDAIADEERTGLDSNGNGILDEGWGHGSHVAGIIKTIAPGVGIMPIRVVDGDGQTSLSQIVEGINFAVDHDADVINLSMSIGESSPALDTALNRAWHAGIVVVTSAGNTASDNIMYPSRENGVLTVTSLDEHQVLAPFANYGAPVNVAAPGVGIVSCHPGGTYMGRSGTSMSAPIVAAQAAMVGHVFPSNSEFWVRSKISTTATGVCDVNPGYNGKLGHGLVDVNKVFQSNKK